MLNPNLICSQLWLFQRKICLVLNIGCWYLLSWFWCNNCSWHSELVDFAGNQPIEIPFSLYQNENILKDNKEKYKKWGQEVHKEDKPIGLCACFFSPLEIYNMQLWSLVAHSLLKVLFIEQVSDFWSFPIFFYFWLFFHFLS